MRTGTSHLPSETCSYMEVRDDDEVRKVCVVIQIESLKSQIDNVVDSPLETFRNSKVWARRFVNFEFLEIGRIPVPDIKLASAQ